MHDPRHPLPTRQRRPVAARRTPVRVLVVDDYPSVLLGIQDAARGRATDVLVVGVATRLAGVECQATQADVVLLDVLLDDGSDVGTNVGAVHARGVSVVAFADSGDAGAAASALDAGAQAVVWKQDPLDRMFDVLASVGSGTRKVRSDASNPVGGKALVPLSQREVEVLHMVMRGLVTKQIARALGVEDSTVKEYLKRIRRKYAGQGRPATTRTDLVRRAVEDGLLERPR